MLEMAREPFFVCVKKAVMEPSRFNDMQNLSLFKMRRLG